MQKNNVAVAEPEASNGHDGPKKYSGHDFWLTDPEIDIPPPLPDGTAPFVKQAVGGIEYTIPMPAVGPSRRSKYPFEQLNKVGASFFVAQIVGADMKKRLTPTVSGANVKLKPRHFIVANVEGGARIWRDR